MPDSTITQDSMTPREAEALAVYDALPEAERSYGAVAHALSVTEGRAGVYVRDALRKAGRDDTPRRGRKANGGTGTTRSRTVTAPNAMMEQYIAQLDAQVTTLEAEVEQTRADADGFDPDVWRDAEAKRLDEIAKEARARATAFAKDENGTATQAATEHGEALRKRADEVQERDEQAIGEAKAALDQARAMLAMVAEQAPAA